jgi:hypothetical protein
MANDDKASDTYRPRDDPRPEGTGDSRGLRFDPSTKGGARTQSRILLRPFGATLLTLTHGATAQKFITPTASMKTHCATRQRRLN